MTKKCNSSVRQLAEETTFFVLYRPPPLDAEAVSYMRLLVQCLSRYEGNKYHSVTVGDLNLPKINTCTGFDNDVFMLFLSYVIESTYIQLVDFPTRDVPIPDVIPHHSSVHEIVILKMLVNSMSGFKHI